MTRFWALALVLAAGVFAVPAWAAGPPVEAQTINAIADEGFNHGEVVETAAYLADRIGGRLTNSPAMRQAEQWTQGRFRA